MSVKLNQTVVFDGTPVFRGLAMMLADARKHGWKGNLVSADRRKGVAEKYGKLSQLALWLGWLAHKVGFNPANPPGRSSHELRSDGVCAPGPVGRPLAWWRLGMDVTLSDQLLSILHQLGYSAFRPYPSGSEAHHLNLHSNPRARLKARGLLATAHHVAPRPTRTSRKGIDLIATFEGFVDHVYKDAVGIPTIGYGHVVQKGEHFPAKISETTGRSLLRRDVRKAERAVLKLVKVPINQNQFDALVSFAFNVGTAALAGSTLLRRLNKREYLPAANEFLKWDLAGGKVLDGLLRRRQAERRLFVTR